MKKLLLVCVTALIITLANATSNQMFYQGPWLNNHLYRCVPIAGTSTYTTPVVESLSITYVANCITQPTTNLAPASDSAWTSIAAESIPLALTSGHIFVGSAGGAPADVAMTGATTINNAGVVSATATSFVTTGTGSSNNVLSGIQTRYGSASVSTIPGNTITSVSVSYGTALTTAAYAVNVSFLEPTVGLPIGIKVKSQTTSGFVAEIENESAAATATGTLYYTTTGH